METRNLLMVIAACVALSATATAQTPPLKKPATKAVKPAVTKDAPPVTITVRANSEITGASFTLGDIAELAGGDKKLTASLSAIQIGVAPLPGLSRLLIPGDVVVRLRAAHIEMKQVVIVAPPSIRVARLGTDVPVDRITREAMDSAQDAIKRMPDAVLEPVPNRVKPTVPAGKLTILAGAWRGQPELGLIYVPVSLIVDGKIAQTVDVAIHIRRKIRAFVASRQLEAHTILTADDVTQAPLDLAAGVGEPVTDITQIVGKRLTRRVLNGGPILAAILDTPPAIAANDRLTIEFVLGSVRISAPGVARQAGAVGKTIRVYAPDTKKELEAVVVDAHTVRIEEQ